MPDFINLTCPSCGGKLQITNDMERFACGYCGNEQVVKREGGTVSLAPVIEEVKKVVQSTDLTAAELAIKRLDGDLTSVGYDLITQEKAYKNVTGLLIAGVIIGIACLLGMIILSSLSKEQVIWCWPGVAIGGLAAVIGIFEVKKSRKRLDAVKEQAAKIYAERETYLAKVRGNR